jgi:hypothetical protein
MSIDWEEVNNFKPHEFDDPEFPGSWAFMSEKTINLLDSIRTYTGWPIITHNKDGIRGCVCVNPTGHSSNSRHYANHAEGCSAVDFHFDTNVDTRKQAMEVLWSGFSGVGIYFDWNSCEIGFHVDFRIRPQIWKRENGEYTYLLK